MAFYPLSLLPPQYTNPDTGNLASGFILQAYIAGTTTPTNFYSDSVGTAIGTSITLNSGGYPQVSGNIIVPWLDSDIIYKFIFTDPDTNMEFTIDNVTGLISTGTSIFDSVAEMKPASLIAGSFVSTQAYYAGGESGGATYLIKTAAQAALDGDTIDGYGNHTLANGNVAILQISGSAKIEQFGVLKDGTDQSIKVQAALDFGINLDFGNSGTIALATSVSPSNSQILFGSGVTIKALTGIESGYTHNGVFELDNLSNVTLDGLIFSIVDTDLPASGALVPQVSAVKMTNSTNCSIKNVQCVGGSNRFTSDPQYQFIGIIDIRECDDIELFNITIDGQYTIVNPGYATSTECLYIDDCNRVRLTNSKIFNAWSSGAVFTDIGNTSNVVTNNIIYNTKGSNLNVGGQEMLVDGNTFQGSTDQGGLSVGEGTANLTVGAVISNNIIQNNFRAGIACSERCRDIIITGNQIRNNNGEVLTSEVGAAIRVKGKFINITNNIISHADAPAIASSSTNLSTPEAERIIISNNNIFGAAIALTSPNCIVSNNQILGVTGGNAISLGFRCAGSSVTNNRAIACGRTVSYSPNTADPNDFANVQIHSNVGASNTLTPDTSCNVQVSGVTGGILKHSYESGLTAPVLDDILHSTEVMTNDGSLPTTPAVAASMEVAVNDAFGTAYRIDFSTGYVSGGASKSHAAMSVKQDGIELRGIPGVSDASLIMNSPNGNRYEITIDNTGSIVINGPL